MQSQRRAPRPRGTGSLYPNRGSWYGTWWVGKRQRKRKVGPMRNAATQDGLTRVQAEARFRKMMDETRSRPVVRERLTLVEAGARYVNHVENVRERKPSTVQDYRGYLAGHLKMYFEERVLTSVTDCDIEDYVATKKNEGYAPKTISNHIVFLNGIFNFAVKHNWIDSNVVQSVDRPSASDGDPDIRFLDNDSVEALMRATPDDELGAMEVVLYLAATTTGLRQGELIALRWKDIDWMTNKVRVRRNMVRGILGTPKSRHSVRQVPLTERLGGELERLSQRSAYKDDDDCVFCHPETGAPYEPSKMRKRFKEAIENAGIREAVRFHDLRHTFGTRMASVGVPMRSLQALMGHKSIQTTEIYADYAPSPHEQEWAEAAFNPKPKTGSGSTSCPQRQPGSELDSPQLASVQVEAEPDAVLGASPGR